MTTKRFFECCKCLKKEYTLGLSSNALPKVKCTGCGNYNWRICGRLGSAVMGDKNGNLVTDRKLVLSASEWSSRKEIESIKAMGGL
jgi:hypothetical protein